MKHDLLHIQGKPFVLVPLHEYRALTEGASGTSNDNPLPDEVLNSLTAAQESAVKILRKFRGLTQQQLAEAAGLSRPYLTEIEKGTKTGSIKALRAVAQALDIDVRHLMA